MAAAQKQDRKDLARVVKTAQEIVGHPLQNLDSVYANHIQKKGSHAATESTHSGNKPFTPLPSQRVYRTLKTRTAELRHSFFPIAMKLQTTALYHTLF